MADNENYLPNFVLVVFTSGQFHCFKYRGLICLALKAVNWLLRNKSVQSRIASFSHKENGTAPLFHYVKPIMIWPNADLDVRRHVGDRPLLARRPHFP